MLDFTRVCTHTHTHTLPSQDRKPTMCYLEALRNLSQQQESPGVGPHVPWSLHVRGPGGRQHAHCAQRLPQRTSLLLLRLTHSRYGFRKTGSSQNGLQMSHDAPKLSGHGETPSQTTSPHDSPRADQKLPSGGLTSASRVWRASAFACEVEASLRTALWNPSPSPLSKE